MKNYNYQPFKFKRMKLFASMIVLCLCFSSCVQLKIAADKRNSVNDLGIAYEYNDKVDDIFKPRVDSVINFVINQFNSEHHSFTVHKAVKGEENKSCLRLSFEKAKYRSSFPIIASCIITPLGLIVTPYAFMAATNGQGFIFFWYLAADKINVTATLSSDIADSFNEPKLIKVRTGATLSSKDSRLRKMSNKLGQNLYATLLKLEK